MKTSEPLKNTGQSTLDEIYEQIVNHPSNALFTELGYRPLYTASPTAKIVIIGQTPGKKAQLSNTLWNDASGIRLLTWLGIEESVFYDPAVVSHLPMDFYYPGKGTSGDLPPRKGFADLWHAKIITHMPAVELIVLIGQYSQRYYLGSRRHPNLTETVRHYRDYLPTYFPLVHPSPVNFRWFSRNPWFEEIVIPDLRSNTAMILSNQDKNPR